MFIRINWINKSWCIWLKNWGRYINFYWHNIFFLQIRSDEVAAYNSNVLCNKRLIMLWQIYSIAFLTYVVLRPIGSIIVLIKLKVCFLVYSFSLVHLIRAITSNVVVYELKSSQIEHEKKVRSEFESSFEPIQFLTSRVELNQNSTHYQPY